MKTSQNQRLLAYLKSHKRGITQGEAHIHLGILRLSERIRELESIGTYSIYGFDADYIILRERERVKGRYGVATVTRYRLAA